MCKHSDMFSLAVLIGRKLDHFFGLSVVILLCSVLRVLPLKRDIRLGISFCFFAQIVVDNFGLLFIVLYGKMKLPNNYPFK